MSTKGRKFIVITAGVNCVLGAAWLALLAASQTSRFSFFVRQSTGFWPDRELLAAVDDGLRIHGYSVATNVGMIAVSALLALALVGGIALLLGWKWGRKLTLITACTTLMVVTLLLTFHLFWAKPDLDYRAASWAVPDAPTVQRAGGVTVIERTRSLDRVSAQTVAEALRLTRVMIGLSVLLAVQAGWTLASLYLTRHPRLENRP